MSEQTMEASRAVDPSQDPLLPATYEWIKRLDRDIGLWGEDE